MKLKRLVPRMIIGATMAAMMAVPVSACNINSGSTPLIEFSRVSSTSADDNSGDNSGKVYDFKDPKTSGVVTVTKSWDDSSSNDERTVPDVSISTEKPSKSALGHVITYHGNGLSFPDGSIQNEIVINNSGKIVSGQYKELYGSLGWYSDKACTQKVKVDSAGLPVNGINADLDLYAKQKTFVLKASYDFNNLIPSMATSVIFTNEIMPISATLINVDKDGDNGVVAWMDKNVMKVSTQSYGQKAIITDCQGMFLNKSNLTTIDFNNLDTSNVKDMAGMFQGCEGLTSLNLSYLKTDEVTNMSYLFYHCTGLTDLDLGSLHTHKVTDMTYMFARCSSITSLDLTSLDTSEVTSMRGMFGNCSDLTNLDLTPLDTQNVTNMSGMFSSCKSLTSMDLSPLNSELLRLLNSRASYWAPIESGLFLCFSYPAAVVFRGMPLLPVA